MGVLNNKEFVKKQYESATNLNTRISIHEKYSVNRQGFGNWIFSHYQIHRDMCILELGCGTGDMWAQNSAMIKSCRELVLSDFSGGMIQAAHEKVGDFPNVTYQVIDIQNIPYEVGRFDAVIANMMLYHVPDLNKGLSEVRRVMKPGGIFYSATYGERGITAWLAELLKPYGVVDRLNRSFTLQNGKQWLSQYFTSVDKLEYMDCLEVTNVDDMLDYIYSLTGMSDVSSIKKNDLKAVLEQNMVDGVLKVPKEYGMFICR